MLHLQFTAADLARTRVAPMAGPLAETVLALGVVSGRRPQHVDGGWKLAAARRVRRQEGELAAVLHPAPHSTLDMFSLTGTSESMHESGRALRRADPELVAAEVRAVKRAAEPEWLAGLDQVDPAPLARLLAALDTAYRRLVEPYWPAFSQSLEASRRRMERGLSQEGVGAALSGLGTGAHWDGETLTLPHAGAGRGEPFFESLAGRGLVLAPTMLVDTPTPALPLDHSRPPILLCPVWDQSVLDASAQRGRHDLNRLMGRSRSRILARVAASELGHSTSEVSLLANVSAATASEHLTVLREAGLVHSTRRGQRVVHTVTPLGRRLLAG